jgi:hypothetical protein
MSTNSLSTGGTRRRTKSQMEAIRFVSLYVPQKMLIEGG